jgi:hypothetical protein
VLNPVLIVGLFSSSLRSYQTSYLGEFNESHQIEREIYFLSLLIRHPSFPPEKELPYYFFKIGGSFDKESLMQN